MYCSALWRLELPAFARVHVRSVTHLPCLQPTITISAPRNSVDEPALTKLVDDWLRTLAPATAVPVSSCSVLVLPLAQGQPTEPAQATLQHAAPNQLVCCVAVEDQGATAGNRLCFLVNHLFRVIIFLPFLSLFCLFSVSFCLFSVCFLSFRSHSSCTIHHYLLCVSCQSELD